MEDYDDFDEGLVGEGPCEFCGELYPLILLIEHQSTHLANAEDRFPYDVLNTEATQNVIIKNTAASSAGETQNKIIGSTAASAPDETQNVKIENTTAKAELEIVSEQKQQSSTGNEDNVPTESERKKQVWSPPIQMEEKGEILLSYGTDIDLEKDSESETQGYKPPYNPLLGSIINVEEDVEDINNLSDDDCSESLEEFWMRARDFLKGKRLRKEIV